MNILQSWSHCLAIFKPANLKLFLLVTIKAIIETYKILFTRFWHLVLAYIVYVLLINIRSNFSPYADLFLPEDTVKFLIRIFLLPLVSFAIIFFMYLIARPSVAQKSYEYIGKYIKHFCYFIIFRFIMRYSYNIIINILLDYYPDLFFTTHSDYGGVSSNKIMDITQDFLGLAFLIPLGFFILFLLDSRGTFSATLSSLVRAIKMTLYTFPFGLIAAMVLYGINQLMILFYIYIVPPLFSFLAIPQAIKISEDFSLSLTSFSISFIFTLGMVVPICFLTNFYIKNIHENFDLYYKRKKA